jgi:serine/threonine protein kinase
MFQSSSEQLWTASQRLNTLVDVIGVRDTKLLLFLDRLLEVDPAKRITPYQALLHAYLVELMPIAPYLIEEATEAASASTVSTHVSLPVYLFIFLLLLFCV